MKIWVLDSEANSLTPDKFWCIVLKEYNKNSYKVFVNDTYYNSIVNLASSLYGNRQVETLKLSEFKTWIEKEYEDACVRTADKVRYVGHNAISFDFYWFDKLLGTDVYRWSSDVRDTYVLSRLASPIRKGGHSIEAWAERVGRGLRKQEIEDEQWSNFDPIMITRCLTDTEIGEKTYEHLREVELRGFSLECIELEHEIERIIAQQQRDGVYIDEQKVSTLHSETKAHADYLEKEIQKVFPIAPVEIKQYNPKLTKAGVFSRNTCGPVPYEQVGGPYTLIDWQPFNIDSPQQRVQRLLKVGWVPTTFSKKTKNPTFTEDSLEHLPEDAPKEVRLFGEYLMSRSRQRLAVQLIEGRDKNGYIHGYVNILGAKSHRMSSNSPNLQNIPSSEEDDENKGQFLKGLKGAWGWDCRDIFTVENPEEDILIDVDASGIQLRGLAHYVGDKDYIKLVSNPDVDMHNLHSEVIDISRKKSKTFLYALIMGAREPKLKSIINSEKPGYGEEGLKRFYDRFPFLKEFIKVLDKDTERGYYIALDGRLIGLDKTQPHKTMSIALQSFEVIIMKKAATLYQKELKKDGIPFIQRLMVHDEYLSQSKIIYKDVVGKAMVNGIIKAGEIFESKCPLDGKAQYGKTWAECH